MLHNENEAYFDEDGRLITSQNESSEEAYFDEDGRLITSQNESSEEVYYDEDGRLITSQNESSEEVYYDEDGKIINREVDDNTGVIKEENLEELTIQFALVDPKCKFVHGINEWEVNEGENGLFFIYNAKEEILNKSLVLKNSEDEIIWESEIRELPQNKIVLVNSNTKKMYITNKVLRSEDITNGEEVYFASIKGNDSDNEILILNISNMINNQTDEDIDVEFNMNNILNEENENMKFMDKSNESIKEQSYLYKNVTFAEETFDRFDSNETTDNLNTDQIEELVLKLSDEKLNDNNEELFTKEVKVLEVEKLVYPQDIKSVVMQSVLNYVPINIDCKKQERENTLEASIVVEKVSNYYVAVLNGFMNRPVYLLNGENQYFEFEGTPKEFLTKIQSIICRMYSMDKEEFNNLTKLFVLDEKIDEQLEEVSNIRILSREELISLIVKTKDKVIIDLLNEKCNIIFNDENNNTVKIVCEGLGLANGNSVLETIKTLSESIGLDKVVLSGLFIDSSLHSKVKVEEDNIYTVNMLSKYVTI